MSPYEMTYLVLHNQELQFLIMLAVMRDYFLVARGQPGFLFAGNDFECIHRYLNVILNSVFYWYLRRASVARKEAIAFFHQYFIANLTELLNQIHLRSI